MIAVRAFPGRDCAARVRVHYLLPHALDGALATLLPDATCVVTPFSAWVSGARDHVKLTLGGAIEASGVVGEHELVVTYGKLCGERPAALIAAVEARIRAIYGGITHVASRADAEGSVLRSA